MVFPKCYSWIEYVAQHLVADNDCDWHESADPGGGRWAKVPVDKVSRVLA